MRTLKYEDFINEKLDIKPVSKERLSDIGAEFNNEITQLLNKWSTMELAEHIDIQNNLLKHGIRDTRRSFVDTFVHTRFKVEDKFDSFWRDYQYGIYKNDKAHFYEKHKKYANSKQLKPQTIIMSLLVMLEKNLKDKFYYPIIELYLERFKEQYIIGNDEVEQIFFKQ